MDLPLKSKISKSRILQPCVNISTSCLIEKFLPDINYVNQKHLLLHEAYVLLYMLDWHRQVVFVY